MSTNDTDNQNEPYPTDGAVRDHEAAADEIGLSYLDAFKIGENVFRYLGLSLGTATVDRLTAPQHNASENIPMTELWDAHQRGDLEFGKWRCQFIAEDESAADTDNR